MVMLTILGTSLVMAQDNPCSKYGLDVNVPRVSYAQIYSINPISYGRSGYHVLKTDHLFFAYCDMDLDYCGTNGG